jgi:excinuclease ABC subunit C
VFIDGRPAKEHYRRFRIRTVESQDDYAMMKEVLTRRLKNYKSDKCEPDERIDLMLIDGGKGHLGVAIQVSQTLAASDFDIAALAKRDEEIFRPGVKESIVITQGSPTLFLLQRIRDEAHRFALDYQKRLRHKLLKFSVLDTVPGLGPRRKEELIRRWGSLERIAALTPEELTQTPGIGLELAQAIIQKLNSKNVK